MFAPVGYKSVRSLNGCFKEVAQGIWPNPVSKPGDSLSDMESSEWQVNAWNRYAEYTRALLEFLGTCPSLSICTTTGIVFRIDGAILYRELAASRTGFTGLWALNHETWCVDLSRPRVWISGAQVEFEHLRKTIRLREKNGLNNSEPSSRLNQLWRAQRTADMIVRTFKDFDGAALIISESDTPTTSEIRNIILSKDLVDRPPSIGRPSTREQVREAYQVRFPNGHGLTSWKEVQALIEEECGLRPSVDTIRRSIGLRN